MHRLVPLAVCVSGCWGSTQPTPPPAPAAVAAIAPAPVTPDVPKYSVWEGKYKCSQGVTAMRLRIATLPDGTADATFEFGPSDENPQPIPKGTYKLTGTLYVGDSGEFELRLVPDKWIDQPPNYSMTGLTARSDHSLHTLKGKIDHPNCDWLEVTRTH